MRIGDGLMWLGVFEESRVNHARSLEIRRSLANTDDTNGYFKFELASSLKRMAISLSRDNNNAMKAIEYLEEAIRQTRLSISVNVDDLQWKNELVSLLETLGDHYAAAGRSNQSESVHAEMLDIARSNVSRDDNNIEFKRTLFSALFRVALHKTNKNDKVKYLTEALDIIRPLEMNNLLPTAQRGLSVWLQDEIKKIQ